MNAPDRKHIVIAGDGVAAWACAAALARSLNAKDWAISVLPAGDDTAHQPFGLGDATLPPAISFLPGVFPAEPELVARDGAAWSFGIALSGWAGPGITYFHPFGTIGADFGPVAFHQVVQRLRQDGMPARLANYSLSAMAAQSGRFQLPDGNPRSALSTCRQGLHVDLDGLRAHERAMAESLGVSRAEGRLASIELDGEGAIAALLTDQGERLEAQLFVDCSGPQASLASELPSSRWDSWSRGMTCNRTMSAVIATPQAPLPYSHAEAMPWGWMQYLPMQGKTVLNAVYRDDLANGEDIQAVFARFAEGEEISPADPLELSFGRRQKAWLGNCVALGASAVLIDPVGVTNLHLLLSGIDRLLRLLPGEAAMDIVAAEYNRQTLAEHTHARDFALLHYRLNGRAGEPLWDRARETAVPATLGYKLQLYANLGRVAMYDFEPVEEIAWINLFDEQGVQPRRLHPIAQGVGTEHLKEHAEKVRSALVHTLTKMPSHEEFLSRVKSEFANR